MYFKNENEYFKSITGTAVMGWGPSLYIPSFTIHLAYFLVSVELIQAGRKYKLVLKSLSMYFEVVYCKNNNDF